MSMSGGSFRIKFRSTFAKIATIYKNTTFVLDTRTFFWTPEMQKKTNLAPEHSNRGYIDTFIVYTQKNLLCIHKRSLVHAQHSCACSGPGTPGARDPKKARSRAWDRPSAFFRSLAVGRMLHSSH